VGIATDYEMDCQCSLSGGARDFSQFYSVQTGSGAHSVVAAVCTGLKRPGH
jgi:hypothetical protein